MPWGAEGAVAAEVTAAAADMEMVSMPAYAPKAVLDTIGAGDTFIAGAIRALLAKRDIRYALRCANTVAGLKCGQYGFANVVADNAIVLSEVAAS